MANLAPDSDCHAGTRRQVALQLGAGFWGPTQDLVNVETLSALELTVALVASTGLLWAVEIEKALWRHAQQRHARHSASRAVLGSVVTGKGPPALRCQRRAM